MQSNTVHHCPILCYLRHMIYKWLARSCKWLARSCNKCLCGFNAGGLEDAGCYFSQWQHTHRCVNVLKHRQIRLSSLFKGSNVSKLQFDTIHGWLNNHSMYLHCLHTYLYMDYNLPRHEEFTGNDLCI